MVAVGSGDRHAGAVRTLRRRLRLGAARPCSRQMRSMRSRSHEVAAATQAGAGCAAHPAPVASPRPPREPRAQRAHLARATVWAVRKRRTPSARCAPRLHGVAGRRCLRRPATSGPYDAGLRCAARSSDARRGTCRSPRSTSSAREALAVRGAYSASSARSERRPRRGRHLRRHGAPAVMKVGSRDGGECGRPPTAVVCTLGGCAETGTDDLGHDRARSSFTWQIASQRGDVHTLVWRRDRGASQPGSSVPAAEPRHNARRCSARAAVP